VEGGAAVKEPKFNGTALSLRSNWITLNASLRILRKPSMKRLALVAFFVVTSVASAQLGGPGVTPVRPGTLPPDLPAVDSDSSFPLRVHLVTARWGGIAAVYHGYGSGNLIERSSTKGFDYGFQCEVPFVANQSPGETYQARWKSSPYQLEILTVEPGVDRRPHICTLRLATKDRPFEPVNTAALSHGVPSSLRKRWQDPDFAYEEPQLDYPLHFHVVDGQRTEDATTDHGWGTANLSESAQLAPEGAEFTYTCAFGFLTNTQLTGFYQGRWVKQGSEIEVLLQRPGSDQIDRCTVEVSLKPQPYPQSHHVAGASETSSSAASVGPVGGNQ
jgi:hypothetical protein